MIVRLFGLEDVDTLDFVHLFGRNVALEEVNLHFRLIGSFHVVFLCHVLAHGVSEFLVSLLYCGEEQVDIGLVWIYAESLFILRLQIECPLAFIVTQHQDLVEVHGSRAFHCI